VHTKTDKPEASEVPQASKLIQGKFILGIGIEGAPLENIAYSPPRYQGAAALVTG
jgi:hypothetical protein